MMKQLLLTALLALGAATVAAKDYPLGTDWSFRGRLMDSSAAVGPFSPDNLQQQITLKAVKDTGWLTGRPGLIAVSQLPKLEDGQKLTFTLTYRQKVADVTGKAFGTIEIYDNAGKRIWFHDGKPLTGSSDWVDQSASRQIDALPEGAATIGISFHLGKSSGESIFVNPRLDISAK